MKLALPLGTHCEAPRAMPSANASDSGPIETFLCADHERIDRLCAQAQKTDGIDERSYAAFRSALLRHIALEEKILLPAARAARNGEPLPIVDVLHAEHGIIAKLLVRSPTSARIAELQKVLADHNVLEEGPGGLYSLCDTLLSGQGMDLVAQMRAYPEVPLAKYYDGPMHTLAMNKRETR
jgi:hypothetical protein